MFLKLHDRAKIVAIALWTALFSAMVVLSLSTALPPAQKTVVATEPATGLYYDNEMSLNESTHSLAQPIIQSRIIALE